MSFKVEKIASVKTRHHEETELFLLLIDLYLPGMEVNVTYCFRHFILAWVMFLRLAKSHLKALLLLSKMMVQKSL